MDLKERVYSVLVVSAAEQFNAALLPLLPSSGYDPVRVVGDVSTAKRAVAEHAFDFVIINAWTSAAATRRLRFCCCARRSMRK